MPIPRSILTIPSSDVGFAEFVAAMAGRYPNATAPEFEQRLRGLLPRVVVRERSLSGERPGWYVYRDGSWRPQSTGPWWLEDGLPRVVASPDGWIVDASRTAADLLGLTLDDDEPRHFTDFVAPGMLEDASQLFEVVNSGRDLDATVVMRPTSGELIAVEVHAGREGDEFVALLRLAEDVDIPAYPQTVATRPSLSFVPSTDVAFRAYAERVLNRMSEPTSAGLELRLRRLYPHSRVEVESDRWILHRDRNDEPGATDHWWDEPEVARATYDSQGLILGANEAASKLFGRALVGHFWQEFVTPGSAEQVVLMLEILTEIGAAESRFRMPMPDGSLLEFDSYTQADGDQFTSAYRRTATQ